METMTPIPESKIPKYLSPSSIGTLKQCPLRFKLTKIDKIREESTAEQLLGILVHETLERLLKLQPPEERTEDAARDIIRDLWDAGWSSKVRKVVPADEMNNFRWRVWWCVENYFALEDPRNLEAEGLEEWLDFEVEGVPMKGVIDRWMIAEDGSFRITDYKTGKVPQPPYEDEKILQLAIYAHGLESKIDHPVETLEWLYLKEGERILVDMDSKYHVEMIEVVTSAWEEMLERCSTGDFPPRTSRLCDWCSFKSNGTCPAWSK